MCAWAPFQTSRKADQLTGVGDPYCQQKHSVQELVWSLQLCLPLPTHPWIFFYWKKNPQRPSNTNYSVYLSIKIPCFQEHTWTDRIPLWNGQGVRRHLSLAWLLPPNSTETSGKCFLFSGPQFSLKKNVGHVCLVDKNFSLNTKFLPSLWRSLRLYGSKTLEIFRAPQASST